MPVGIDVETFRDSFTSREVSHLWSAFISFFSYFVVSVEILETYADDFRVLSGIEEENAEEMHWILAYLFNVLKNWHE